MKSLNNIVKIFKTNSNRYKNNIKKPNNLMNKN